MTAICANRTNQLIKRLGRRDERALTNLEQKVNIVGMDDRSPSILSSWSALPAASVRAVDLIDWRLAAKLGPEITLRDLMERFSYDCLWRAEARLKKGKSACGVYLPDLGHKRPPDLPPGMVKLRLVKGRLTSAKDIKNVQPLQPDKRSSRDPRLVPREQ
jgi:hypothetical protein